VLLPEAGSLCSGDTAGLSVSHEVAIFAGSRPVPSWPQPQPQPCFLGPPSTINAEDNGCFRTDSYCSQLPQPPIDFEGREGDMHRVITTVLSRRLVSLVGDEGVGKSALAASVCRYVADRGMLENGVLYLRAREVRSHARFLVELERVLDESGGAIAAQLKALTKLRQEARPVRRKEQGVNGDDDEAAAAVGGSMRASKPRSRAGSLSALSALEAAIAVVGPEIAAPTTGASVQADRETLIVAALAPFKLLLVIDNPDVLLASHIAASDFKFFLTELFSRTKHVKVLVTATATLSMRHVRGLGVVENCVNVGPLTLRSTLRLFARLSPSMVTAQSKADFVNALLPLKQIHVTVDSRELTTVSSEILSIFGNGHPSKIISLACSSTEETVSSLRSAGERIASTDGLAVRIQDLPAV